MRPEDGPDTTPVDLVPSTRRGRSSEQAIARSGPPPRDALMRIPLACKALASTRADNLRDEGRRSYTSYLLNAPESPAAPSGPCVGGFDAAGFAMGLGAAPNMPFSPRGLAPRSSVFGRSLMMRATPPPQSHPHPRRVHSWVA